MIMTPKEFNEQVAVQIPPADPDCEAVFRSSCIKTALLIYDNKKHECVCTRCGARWEIYDGEYARMHGLQDYCPECNELCIAVSAGRGRKRYEERHRVMTFASDGKNLWSVINDLIADFSEFDIPKLWINPIEIFKISADEQKHWRHYEGWWWSPERWEELKTMNTAPLPAAPYCESKVHAHVFNWNIAAIMQNSDLRYLADEDLMNKAEFFNVITYLSLQMKYPALELLRKGGFKTLANQRIHGRNYQRAINVRAKSIEKAVNLPKKWIKALRRIEVSDTMTSRELKNFQRLSEKNKQAVTESEKTWTAFTSLYNSWNVKEKLPIITKYTTIEKYIRYMAQQKNQDVGIFTDYIKDCEILGYDLRRKSILFPPNLLEAHEETMQSRKIVITKKKDELIANNAIDIEYQEFGFVAICATSQEALNKESAALNHCVRTYGDKVAEGETLIYFIRKKEDPETPFYTLEITPNEGRVVQCRGLKNCNPTSEVMKFRDGLEKEFRKIIKERRTQTCQRA